MKPIGPRLAMSRCPHRVLDEVGRSADQPATSTGTIARPIMIRPAARPGLGRAAASTSDTAGRGASAGRPVGPREARWSKPAWVAGRQAIRTGRPDRTAVQAMLGRSQAVRLAEVPAGVGSRLRRIRLVHIGRHFVEAACGTVAVGIAGHRNPVCLAGGIRQTPTTGVAH